MGGYGSSRWHNVRTRGTVEQRWALDIRRLQRDHALVPGAKATVSWSRDGEASATIRCITHSDRTGNVIAVELQYRVSVNDGPAEQIAYSVPVVYTPCHYGGQRPWFRCPGVQLTHTCNRRVAILYSSDHFFLCRYCLRLAYPSQHEDEEGRARLRARRIRARLGGVPRRNRTFPAKPPAMRWRTYRRLLRQGYDAEILADTIFMRRVNKLLSRLERRRVRR